LLPTIPEIATWQSYFPPNSDTEHRGDVALFTGCIANVFDREALDASRRLLNKLGYGVHVPPTQGCCGAMAQHSGHPDEAAQLAEKNISAFTELDIEAVVHTASGCTAQLREYPLLPGLADRHTEAAIFLAEKIKDISQFLSEITWPTDMQPAPLEKTISLHTPCSLNNVLHQAEAPRNLLQRIPKLEIAPLPQTTRCCGGAGQYMLEQPEFAQQLRDKILDSINIQQKVDILVTSNLGCALHLTAGLRERGQEIRVTHPVVLLAHQLGLKTER
jgi:glycolate oxidase iron-sulfur subunit